MERKINSVIISFGSNIGNRLYNFDKTVERLNSSNIEILKFASLIETEPEGMDDCSDKFLNTVILANTTLEPIALLNELKRIEIDLGRNPLNKSKSLPRSVDLDIIFYDDLILNSEELTIPHPSYKQRYFVMQPLMDIVPDWVDPELKITINKLYQQCFFS